MATGSRRRAVAPAARGLMIRRIGPRSGRARKTPATEQQMPDRGMQGHRGIAGHGVESRRMIEIADDRQVGPRDDRTGQQIHQRMDATPRRPKQQQGDGDQEEEPGGRRRRAAWIQGRCRRVDEQQLVDAEVIVERIGGDGEQRDRRNHDRAQSTCEAASWRRFGGAQQPKGRTRQQEAERGVRLHRGPVRTEALEDGDIEEPRGEDRAPQKGHRHAGSSRQPRHGSRTRRILNIRHSENDFPAKEPMWFWLDRYNVSVRHHCGK